MTDKPTINPEAEEIIPAHTYSKLTVSQSLVLGAGGIPDIGMQYAMKSMANPIFNVVYGVDPFLIGIAFSLPRFWEIFIDPWIGTVSDNTRGPWGRRHPYMVAGGIFGALTFILVWFVPSGLSPALKGWWLIFFALAHFTAYSFFMVPYSALLGEVSTIAAQRMKLMSYRTIFTNVGSFCIGWLYWLCQSNSFSSPAQGMKSVGTIFGLIILAGSVLPILVCRDSRKYHAVKTNRGEKPLREWAIIKELLGLKPFRGILLAIFCLMTSALTVSSLGFYIALCFMFHGDEKAVGALMGISGTISSLAVFLFCPMINVISARLGERPTLYLSLGVAIAGCILGFWAATPAHPYWSVVTGIFTGFGMTAFWVIMPAMTGELSRQHEIQTGQSIYGSFYALYGIALKIGASVGLLLTGLILDLTGYHSSLGVEQSEATIFWLRTLNATIPAVGLLASLYCLYTSPALRPKFSTFSAK
jgi:GPH family glycoside/pentoside/hexuronide:cation symporter